MTQPERLSAIAPGTPMWKAVPPRLVGPYLTGQRTVLAGYVYRAQDVRFHNPAEAYLALSLGWEDSEFTPHMSEIYLMAWLARAIDGYVPATGPGIPEFYIEPISIPVGAGMCRLGPDGDQLVARAIDGYMPATGPGVPEFYIEPISIPVGAGMCRLGPDGDQLVARYDGLAWQRVEP